MSIQQSPSVCEGSLAATIDILLVGLKTVILKDSNLEVMLSTNALAGKNIKDVREKHIYEETFCQEESPLVLQGFSLDQSRFVSQENTRALELRLTRFYVAASP